MTDASCGSCYSSQVAELRHHPTRRKRWLRVAGLVASSAVVVVGAYVGWLWHRTPDVEGLKDGPAPVSSVMRIDAKRMGVVPRPPAYAPIDAIGPLLACAVVKAEDVRFFAHAGIDWSRLWDAAMRLGQRGGASTITQQLARNLFLNRERSLDRKLREALVARRIEGTLEKTRTLELYLNVVAMGPRLWGVKAASEHYFGKAPDALGPFEVSFLSALIAAPNARLAGRNLERTRRTQRRVLNALHMSGLVSYEELQAARGRLERFVAALRRGTSVEHALELDGVAPTAAPRRRRRREALPKGRAFALGCGYERELEEAEHALR